MTPTQVIKKTFVDNVRRFQFRPTGRPKISSQDLVRRFSSDDFRPKISSHRAWRPAIGKTLDNHS